jgi:hypothetical protein
LRVGAITFVIIAFGIFGVSPVSAQLHTRPKSDSMRAIFHSQTVNLKHSRYVCKHGANANQRWHCKAKVWLAKERRETFLKLYPPRRAIKYLSAWICIHNGEGSWTANTGNGYYGGLQMDWSFMSTYGGYLLRTKGTANNWTPYEQMVVAERAHDSGRGFYPWPTTARRCGLI